MTGRMWEHQITFDVRQPKTHAFSLKRLRKFCRSHPHVNVIRYTTFFHQFTLVFDELAREKFVDWYGYSASVSPYILEQFERSARLSFGRSISSTRATITTSTGSRPKNTRISRLSSAGRWQS